MTEQVGASAVANIAPPAAIETLTNAEAVARLSERQANAEWRTKYLEGNQAHREEFAQLHARIAATKGEAQAQAINEQGAMGLRKYADLNDAEALQIVSNQPTPPKEREAAELELSRCKRDKEFMRKLYDGDKAANTHWTRLHTLTRNQNLYP